MLIVVEAVSPMSTAVHMNCTLPLRVLSTGMVSRETAGSLRGKVRGERKRGKEGGDVGMSE